MLTGQPNSPLTRAREQACSLALSGSRCAILPTILGPEVTEKGVAWDTIVGVCENAHVTAEPHSQLYLERMALFAQHGLPVPHSKMSVGNSSPQLHGIAGLATKSRGKVGRHYLALLTRSCETAVHREAR